MAQDGHIVLGIRIDDKNLNKIPNTINNALDKTKKALKGVGNQITTSYGSNKSVKQLQNELNKTNEIIEKTRKEIAQIGYETEKMMSDAFVNPKTNEPELYASEKEKYEKMMLQYDKLQQKLDANIKKAQELGVALEEANQKNIPGINAVTKGIDKFGKRITNIVKRVFVFSVFLKILRALANVLKNVAMGDKEFSDSLQNLKAALWTLAVPLLNVLIPALKAVVNWLTRAAVAVGKFFAMISGKSYAAMVQNAKALKSQADGYKKTGKSAKDASKQLAAFDEIQTLSSDKSEGGEGSSSQFGNAQATQGSTAIIDTIMGVVGSALVALGVLLIWSGQIGWGIGFIIAGATVLGVSVVSVANSNLDFSQQFSSIATMTGEAILALGLVLFFKTKNNLAHSIGLGMIVAGAGILAIGAIQTAANNIGGDVGNMLHGIVAIASGILLAIGLIMMFSGQITPVSIGLVVSGAVGLASEIALYPEALIESLRGWLGAILALISGVLLVIGIIMCCCGVITPVSIGLIVAGAVGLAATIAVNWNFIVEQMRGTFGNIMGIVSAGLLVLGIILCCCGVITPLTIGMIIAGAAGMVTVIAFNWNFIVDKIKETWNTIKTFWNTHIAKWFTKEHWANLAKNMMNGLIEKIEAGLNKLLKKFHDANIGKALDFIAGGLGFDIPKSITIPRLARGAVIPPNKEFLAVLGDQKHGTNIEAPAELIKQMAMEAMLEVGMTGQPTKEEHYYLNETELMSIVYKLVKGGERLKGNSLVSGGAY